jgi:hypothetical protein
MKFVGLCGKCQSSGVETTLIDGIPVCDKCRNNPISTMP